MLRGGFRQGLMRHAPSSRAGWQRPWDRLGDDEIALLTSVGATLFREGFERGRK